jgi:ribonuclease HII
LDVTVRARAVAFGLGWATAAEVDEFGLSWAVKQSGLRALEDMLGCAAGVDHYDVVILDGNHNYLKAEFTAMDDPRFSEVFVKGDQKIIPVSAASIIAKVARDRYMTELAAKYPGYGFESHKGYGSKSHQKAIAELGFLDGVHRRSWKPFRETEKVDD